MKWGLAILVVLALLPAVHAMSAEYNVVIDDAGDSFVALNVEGSGTLNLPLPLDVDSPNVEGAIYVQAENGIDIYVGSTERAVILYDSSLFTSKANDTWTFAMELGDASSNSVILSLPPNAEVLSTSPTAYIEQKDNSVQVSWSEGPIIDNLEATYKLGERRAEGGDFTIYIAVVVILIIIVAAFMYFKKPSKGSKKTEGSPTQGQKNILKALTENEEKIVNILSEKSGSLRRNKLERASGLAKSSLASSLHNLERRNIVKVDKTSTVHRVELTSWFNSL